jgi:Uncharacterized conserved protein
MVAQASPADVTFYGRTLTNWIPNGNFEKDSNGDGLADGWGIGPNIASKSLDTTKYTSGTKSQLLTTAATNGNRYLSCTINPEAGKYYIFLVDVQRSSLGGNIRLTYKDASLSTAYGGLKDIIVNTAGVWLTGSLKFTGRVEGTKIVIEALGSDATNVNIDSARLFEVSAADYAKVDVEPEFTGDKLAERLSAVDGVKHLQGVWINKIGKNLFPPFTNWTLLNADKWTINSPYSGTVKRTSSGQGIQYIMPCLPNQAYTCSVVCSSNVNGIMSVYGLDSAGVQQIIDVTSLKFTKSFTTPPNVVKLSIILAGTLDDGSAVTFDDPLLELGTIKTSFEEYNADYIWLPTILASNLDSTVRDIAYERENVWYKLRRWILGLQLSGNVTNWAHQEAYTGYKRIRSNAGFIPYHSSINQSLRVIKYNGIKLVDGSTATGNSWGSADGAAIGSDGTLYITIRNTEAGWAESFTPNSSSIAAFMNGWITNNGTLGMLYDGTGTRSYAPIVTPKANLVGKIAGSVVENPHMAKSSFASTLIAPTGSWTEFGNGYSNLSALDGSVTTTTTTNSGGISKEMYSISLIEHVLRKHNGAALFGAAVTIADRVTWLKANIGKITANLFAYGSGPAGNKITVARWNGTAWATNTTGSSHTNGSVSKIQAWGGDPTAIGQMIDANGFAHFLAYADASDGTTASTVYTDYIDLDVELNVQTVPTTGYSSVEYTPPMLDYVLAQPVEETIVGAVGSLSLAAGGNVVELFEGAVVEEVTPAPTADNYHINRIDFPSGLLKNRLDKLLGIYKNDKLEPLSKWTIVADDKAYGKQRFYIAKADFDETAKYKVVYTVLDKHLYTCNAVEAKVEYKSTAKSIQGELVQDVTDLKTMASININAVAAIYARLKAGGL